MKKLLIILLLCSCSPKILTMETAKKKQDKKEKVINTVRDLGLAILTGIVIGSSYSGR